MPRLGSDRCLLLPILMSFDRAKEIFDPGDQSAEFVVEDLSLIIGPFPFLVLLDGNRQFIISEVLL